MTTATDTVAPAAGLDLTAAAALAPDEVLKRLGSSDSGLSSQEAADRLSHDGPNVVSSHRVSALAIL